MLRVKSKEGSETSIYSITVLFNHQQGPFKRPTDQPRDMPFNMRHISLNGSNNSQRPGSISLALLEAILRRESKVDTSDMDKFMDVEEA